MSSDLIIGLASQPPQTNNQSPCAASSFRTLPNRYQAVKAQSAERLVGSEEPANGLGRPLPKDAAERRGRQAHDAPAACMLGLEVDDLEPLRDTALLLEILDRLGFPTDLVDELVGNRLAARVDATLLKARDARRIDAPTARHQPDKPAL